MHHWTEAQVGKKKLTQIMVDKGLSGESAINLVQVEVNISRYASRNPAEFVAEMTAGHLTGKKFPDWAWKLYKLLGGPEAKP